MAIKTRLEILEDDFNSATAQVIEHEINKLSLEKKMADLAPGKEYDEVKAMLDVRVKNMESVQGVIDIINELIAKEAK